MIKKAFKSVVYIFPIMMIPIIFITQLWNPSYLITPPQLSGFSYQMELTITILLIVFYSLLLPNKFEIELAIVKGYSTTKLAFQKACPIYVCSLITVLFSVGVFRYTPFDVLDFHSVIPIYVPGDFKKYILFSLFVSVSFFSSLYFFFRVLLRNCYLPIITGMLFHSTFQGVSDMVKKGWIDIRFCLFDPFISTYIVGNKVPNLYASGSDRFVILTNAWIVNRLIFIFLSLILLTATYLLLRCEKLHRGIGE